MEIAKGFCEKNDMQYNYVCKYKVSNSKNHTKDIYFGGYQDTIRRL